MTIEDITNAPWFARPPNKPGAVHKRLPRFPFPVAKGKVPHGTSARQTLRRVVEAYRHLFSDQQRRWFLELAAGFAAYADDHYTARKNPKEGDTQHPLRGVLTQSAFYPPFIEVPAQPDPIPTTDLDGVRALILLYVVARSPQRRTIAAISELAAAIGNPLVKRDLDNAKIISSILGSPNQSSRHVLTTAIEHVAGITQEHAVAIAELLPRPGAKIEDGATPPAQGPADPLPAGSTVSGGSARRQDKPPGHRSSRETRKHGGVYLGIRTPLPDDLDAPPEHEVPLDDIEDTEGIHIPLMPRPDDEAAPVIDETPGVDRWRSQEVHDYFQAEDTRQYLYGPLLPDSNRVLSAVECRKLVDKIRDLLVDSERLMGRAAPVFGATGTLLMLLTGRDRSQVASALLANRHGDQTLLPMRLAGQHWVGTQPTDLPRLGDLDPGWFEDVMQEIRMPLPELVLKGIRLLGSVPAADIATLGPELIASTIQDLRKDIPRLSQARLRATVAASIYAISGHTRDWQIILGQSGDRSTAPLHYYAPTLGRLQDIYCSALKELGIPVTTAQPSREQRIGAARAALRKKRVQQAVEALRRRTISAITLSARTTLIQLLNAYVASAVYAAAFFACCALHRHTARLAGLRRGDFLQVRTAQGTACLAVIWDKGARAETGSHLVALTESVTAQIDTLLRYAQRLIDHPEFRSDRRWHSARVALEKSIRSEGPVWLVIDPETGQTSPLDRHALQTRWEEMAVPLPLLRHLGATHLGEYGAAGGDIAQQMGHSIDRTPFDLADPEGPVDFALRLGPTLDTYLGELGFTEIGLLARRNRTVSLLPVPGIQHILSQASRDKKAYAAHRRQCEPRPSTKDRQRAEDRVAAWMKQFTATDEWAINPDQIDAALGAYSETSPTTAQATAVRDALVTAVKARADLTGKRQPAIPSLVKMLLPLAEIRSVHLDAYRLVRQLEAAALEELTTLTPEKEAARFCEIGRILIAIWGLGSCVDRQRTILSDTSRLLNIPGTLGLAYLASPLDLNYPDELAGQVVPNEPVPLLYRLVALRSEPGCREVDGKASFTGSEKILEALGADAVSFEEIFQLISLARQVTATGQRAAWERGDLAHVGLAPERLAAALHNVAIDRSDEVENSPEHAIAGTARRQSLRPRRDYANLRSSLHRAVDQPGNLQARRKLQDLAADLSQRYQPLEFIGAAARDILRTYEKPGSLPGRSSIYSYMTRLSSLILRYEGQLISNVDPEQLDEDIAIFLVRFIVGGKQKKRQQTESPRSAIGWILRLFADHGFAVELPSIAEGDKSLAHRRPGYLASGAETQAIIHQVARWEDMIRNSVELRSKGLGATAAHLGLLLQTFGELRLRELSGLLVGDLNIEANAFTLAVHPRRKRGLKTRASNRLVFRNVTPEQSGRIAYLTQKLTERRTDTQSELFATESRQSISSITHNYADMRKAAAIPVLGKLAGWTHIYRPSYATAVGLSLSPHRPRGLQLNLPRIINSHDGWGLPNRVKYLYHARQLGHGSPVTTAEHYDRAITLQTDTMRGWRGASLEQQANLLGITRSALDKRVSRQHQKPRAVFWPELSPLYESEALAPFTDFDRPPDPGPMRHRTGELSLIAETALRMRQGLDGATLGNELGVDAGMANKYMERVWQAESALRTGFLSPVATDQARPEHSRRPRSHRLLPAFAELDRQLSAGDLLDADLAGFLIHLGQRVLLPLQARTEAISSIEQTFAIFRANDHSTGFTKPEKQLACLALATYLGRAATSS
jgi:hypothetical protein